MYVNWPHCLSFLQHYYTRQYLSVRLLFSAVIIAGQFLENRHSYSLPLWTDADDQRL